MTGMSSLVTGLVVLATLLFATPLLHHLPNAALAAAIAVAVITLVDVPGMRRCWQANRHDGLAVVITALGTLLLAPDLVAGVLLGAGLAMFLFLARTMTPRTVVLGQHADGTWRDADRHGLPVHEHLIMLRVDGRLFFASVTHVEQAVLGVLRRFPGVRAIILHGDGINEIDAAGEDLLRKLHRRLDDNGVILAFAGLKAQVTDVLTNTGLERELGPTRLFRSPEAALVALERELDLPETTPRFDTAAP
jgi:SulP family sulfate permease